MVYHHQIKEITKRCIHSRGIVQNDGYVDVHVDVH